MIGGLGEMDAEYDDDPFEDPESARRRLQENYRFYVMNPEHTRGVEYSLWICTENGEYPIISSNTGGFPSFYSRSPDVGDGLEPTDAFLDAVWMGAHEAMSFTPTTYFEGDYFQQTLDVAYDGKPREYEGWVTATLVDWMVNPNDEPILELKPFVRWADAHTEFEIPMMRAIEEQ